MKPAICNVSENDNACVKDSSVKKNEHETAGVIEEMHEDNLRKSRFGPLSMFIIQEDLSKDFEKNRDFNINESIKGTKKGSNWCFKVKQKEDFKGGAKQDKEN
ncbi:hypothetical protein ACFE04_020729 [Oxalis oulophora]